MWNQQWCEVPVTIVTSAVVTGPPATADVIGHWSRGPTVDVTMVNGPQTTNFTRRYFARWAFVGFG